MSDTDAMGLPTLDEKEKAEIRNDTEHTDLLGLPKYNAKTDK